MGTLEKVEIKVNRLLNCDYDPRFEINSLTDLPVSDGSLHYRISKGNNYVDFGVFNSEIAAYTWDCPGEGRIFLEALEEYAAKEGLTLTIPTVLNPKLESILKDNGYTMKEVPYLDDVCELWSKN